MAEQSERELEIDVNNGLLEDYSNRLSTALKDLNFEDLLHVHELLKIIGDMFYNITFKIRGAVALNIKDKLIAKIDLINRTTPDILKYKFTPEHGRAMVLYEEQADNLYDYSNNYLQHIDERLISSLTASEIKKNDEAINDVVSKINNIFYYNSEMFEHTLPTVDSSGIASPGFQTHRDELDEAINKSETILRTIPLFSNAQANDKDKKAEEVKEALNEIVNKARKEFQKSERKLQAVEELSAERLTAYESRYFQETADKHKKKCTLFLWWAFVLGATTILWGIFSHSLFAGQNKFCEDDKSLNIIPCLLSNLYVKDLLVGGVLVAGILACLRAYFANAHSEVVNRHRFNALQAYEYLYKITEGNDRSMVMQKATEAIFEHVPTGFTKYHKEDNKSSDNNNAQLALILASLVNKTTPKGDGS